MFITGMYGGKFMPFHKGHRYCIEYACDECETVYVILFYGSDSEMEILKYNKADYLSVEARKEKVVDLTSHYCNAIPAFIDVTNCKYPDGTEDWDAETPLVRQFCPHIDYVYSSEPSYDAYFKRAYPEATHILVDVSRTKVPISSTKIRNMINEEEKKIWRI
jgi:HTH-type transcriptional repressor of NAD biosynthesis genes